MIAGVEVFETDGVESVLPGFNRITPVEFAIASTPDNASTIPTNPFQFVPMSFDNGCKFRTASPRCGMLNAAKSTTTTTVGTAIRNANPPVCLGPK